jgi:pimeloyl-ACP methyl ester carboxylesterase
MTLLGPVAPGARAAGLPRKATLGVLIAPAPSGGGVLVKGIAPGYPVGASPLRANDVIVTCDGDSMSVPTLISTIAARPAGSTVALAVLRGGGRRTLHVKLFERLRDPGDAFYTAEYSDITSHGHRMRTILTHPRAAGRHPGFMFIQGYSPLSYDFPLTASGLDAPILRAMADSGFVTMRVDKPGVGDSEGGPFADVDFITEADIYRQALLQLKSQPDVNPEDVFIFGHSMGGAFGPLIACEIPVRGLILYGVAARTWHEYLLDTVRYQALLAGKSYAAVDDEVRQSSRILELVFQDHKSPADVKREHPEYAAMVDSTFVGGRFNGKTATFWEQLEDTNFADLWTRANTRVYALHGASDFVTYDVDHQLIADIVNREHPGWGRFEKVPDSDHVFANWKTEAESMQHFPAGDFNPAFIGMMQKWIAGVRHEFAAGGP